MGLDDLRFLRNNELFDRDILPGRNDEIATELKFDVFAYIVP